jgi:hypothetical protein
MKDGDTSALDRAVARSLERAGIEVARLGQPSGNPASRVRGRLGPIEFARALSGWTASGPLPLAVARALYKHPVARSETRVGGRVDQPPPERPWVVWYTADGERVYPVHLQARFRSVSEQSPALVRMSPPAIFHDEPARIGAAPYIDLYEIDSEHGLRIFASVLRAHNVNELVRPAWWTRHKWALSIAWLAGDTSAAPSEAVPSSWDRDTEEMPLDDDD